MRQRPTESGGYEDSNVAAGISGIDMGVPPRDWGPLGPIRAWQRDSGPRQALSGLDVGGRPGHRSTEKIRSYAKRQEVASETSGPGFFDRTAP